MADRVTGERKTRKKKGHAPAHQNTFAFHHNKNSGKSEKIANIPNIGLCGKCHDIIEWKKQYRKYKPRTVPGKCVSCDQKNVTFAYHILCLDCATKLKVCAKCKLSKEIAMDEKYLAMMAVTEDQALNKLQASGLRERERRSVLRDLERGHVTPAEVVAALDGKITIEDGDDESEQEDEDDDEDMDEQVDDQDDEKEEKAAGQR